MNDAERKKKRESALCQIEAILTVCPFHPRAQAVLFLGYLMGMRDIRDPSSKVQAILTFERMMQKHPEGEELCEWLHTFFAE